MDIVTRNIREAKDRMGEMTVRFKMACEHTSRVDQSKCSGYSNSTPKPFLNVD